MKWEDLRVEAERARAVAPRLMRRDSARSYLGAAQLFDLMEERSWIAPIVAGNRMTLFDQRDLDTCIDRLRAGEFPGRASARAA